MKISGCDNRVKKPMVLVGVLGLAPRRTKIYCRYTELIRLCFQHKCIASLGAVSTVLCTPLQEGEMKEKGEVLHLYRCYPHTHTTSSHTTLMALGARLVHGAAAVCVAGVGDIGLHFVWQAWHFCTASAGVLGSRWRRGCLCV